MLAEPLAKTLISAANLPFHHPAVLQTNMLANRRAAAVASIQSLLSLLQPPDNAPADSRPNQVADLLPVRKSGEAAGLLFRRPSQNRAQALASPAAAFSDGPRPSMDALSQAQPEGSKSLVKAADLLDPGLLSWAEEMASEPGNSAARKILAWDDGTAESSSAVSRQNVESGPTANGEDHQQMEKKPSQIARPGKTSGLMASTGKPAADPTAFIPGAFGMGDPGGGSEEEEGAEDFSQKQAATDNGGFDLSAFGFGAPAQPKQDAERSKQQPVADPGAFDPSAFGFGSPEVDDDHEGKPSAGSLKSAADPGAFNPNAFGFGMSNESDKEDDVDDDDASATRTNSQPAADPGTFDPSAFGFGFAAGQHQDEQKPTSNSRSKPAADPGAFDPAAFGFGLSNGQSEDADESKPISKAKPAADPGAFDPSAFGLGDYGNGNEHSAANSHRAGTSMSYQSLHGASICPVSAQHDLPDVSRIPCVASSVEGPYAYILTVVLSYAQL